MSIIDIRDFMINLHGSYVAKQGFEIATTGSAARHPIKFCVYQVIEEVQNRVKMTS